MTDRRLSNLKSVLHSSECKEALRLWDEGKDTSEIKSIMGATEAAVYNALHELRGPRKKKRRLGA